MFGILVAALVTVTCGADGPGFHRINDALATLDPAQPHTIIVSGVCQENLNLTDFSRLTIQAPENATATINPGNTQQPTIFALRVKSLELRRLVVPGGVIITRGSDAVIHNSRFENSPAAGLAISRGSTLLMTSSILTGNAGPGLVIDHSSSATIGGSNVSSLVEIRDNGSGIFMDGSTATISGMTAIEGNRGSGINTTGGTLVVDGRNMENFIRNNATGLLVRGSHVTFSGQNTIQSNRGTGVSISSGSVVFNSSNDNTRVTTIEGNILGLNIAASASASFSGAHKIRNNGDATSTDRFVGGIRVGTVSRIQINGPTEITNNLGPGVLAEFNSALSFDGVIISNNLREGLLVVRNSTAFFDTAPTMAGNGTSSISCDSTALVIGDISGVSNIRCMRIERENGPPRPGAIRDREQR